MKTWQAILNDLQNDKKVALLYVLQSVGSSPGRQGFKMKVNEAGEMEGSIGGGFMEHKLVELAKSKFGKSTVKPFVKQQIHRKDAELDQSGMICSGQQTVAFYFLNPSDLVTIASIIDSLKHAKMAILNLNHVGISLVEKSMDYPYAPLFKMDKASWSYSEPLGVKPRLYIIGAGHVGLSLSRNMRELGFHVIILDDREGLNTLDQNNYAHEARVINYNKVASHVKVIPDTYVVIMTFGYRPDKVVLKQLVGKNFTYLGMLGSEAKVNQLMAELREEGVDPKALTRVRAPIGIQIASHTPAEIAISIAAEIISIKNSKKASKAKRF